MQGIRLLTLRPDTSPEFHALISHPNCLLSLIEVLVQASAKAKSFNKSCYDSVQVDVMCDALWALQNLSFVAGVSHTLVVEHKIQRVILAIFIDHFIEDTQITELKIKLLTELLWHTANIIGDARGC